MKMEVPVLFSSAKVAATNGNNLMAKRQIPAISIRKKKRRETK